ncbi:MAG TPA: hypothetical protein VJ840_02570 [Gemmatimonadaceae bacterium]|nr:hypothetical protein [Gemmatimonadaceae bacterium]
MNRSTALRKMRVASRTAYLFLLLVSPLGALTAQADLESPEPPRHVLDTVKVTGSISYFSLLSGFNERRKLGLGKFFTAAQLDSAPHESVADLVSRRIAGLHVQWSPSRIGARIVSLRGPVKIRESECFVRVYVDNNRADDQDLAHIQSGDVAGVEYYSMAPPPQYAANGLCGVLLLWTRR